MIYVWIEDGKIRATPFEDTAKEYAETYFTLEIDITDVDKLKVIDGKVVFKTEEEIVNEKKNDYLNNLKSMFAADISKTDYILLKIQERITGNQPYEDLKQDLEKRVEIREAYNTAKQTIKNATTIEQLEMAIKQYQETINAIENN